MKQPSGRKRVTKRVETEPRDGGSEPPFRMSLTMPPEKSGRKVIFLAVNFNIDHECLAWAAGGMVQALNVAGSRLVARAFGADADGEGPGVGTLI